MQGDILLDYCWQSQASFFPISWLIILLNSIPEIMANANHKLSYCSNRNVFPPLGQKIIRNLRASIFSSILRQEVAFFDRTRTGELINRLSADTAVVGDSVTDNLSDGLRAVAQAVAGVSMMVSLKVRAVCWQDLVICITIQGLNSIYCDMF